MNGWLGNADEFAVGLIAAMLIVAGGEVGAAIAQRQRGRSDGDADRFLATLAGPSVGLLALMIGFSFAMALSRFDARRSAVLSEANAIGTAALRGRLLPEPYDAVVAPLFREYTELRVSKRGDVITSPAVLQRVRRSLDIQEELWRTGMAAAAANPRVVPAGLFIQALNTMIDVHQERITAARNRVPPVVFFTLEGIAIIAFGFAGYGLRVARVRARYAMWIMAVMFASVIMLVFDLDRPRDGFIMVSQRPLMDLIDSYK
ncbi:MAG: hypothetical protein P4M09_14860 [Devosia sp.]|nr:hypothetical protein [Devosia sp.]